ncbi:Ribonuclease HII [Trichinella spiralis]|uniref:Ribonuclease HII n=1 Tax=Trichinella spiralis TaxID=6334 RepID=A0ABR3KQG4_TRISP
MFSSSYQIVSEIQIHAELVRPRRVCGSGAHHDFEWLFLFYATARTREYPTFLLNRCSDGFRLRIFHLRSISQSWLPARGTKFLSKSSISLL